MAVPGANGVWSDHKCIKKPPEQPQRFYHLWRKGLGGLGLESRLSDNNGRGRPTCTY